MKLRSILLAIFLFSWCSVLLGASYALPLTADVKVCDNGTCRSYRAGALCVPIGKTDKGTLLCVSCKHPFRGTAEPKNVQISQKPARIITSARDCDLLLLEVDSPWEMDPFILSASDVGPGTAVCIYGLQGAQWRTTFHKTLQNPSGRKWIVESGWPTDFGSLVTIDTAVPVGYSGGPVYTQQGDDAVPYLYGILIQADDINRQSLFIPVSKVKEFLGRAEKAHVTNAYWKIEEPKKQASGKSPIVPNPIDAPTKGTPKEVVGFVAGLDFLCPKPPQQRPKPQQVPVQQVYVPPSDGQVKAAVEKWVSENADRLRGTAGQRGPQGDIGPRGLPGDPGESPALSDAEIAASIQKWFLTHKQEIISGVVAGLPPQKPVEIPELPPITVEAWEQVLDADGAPVGEPRKVGSQTYPVGSPLKIVHYKMLAK